MAFWARFFGSAGSQAVGVGLGTTAVPALLPAAQYLINDAWNRYPDHPLLASVLAEGVAQGQVDAAWAKQEARFTGISGSRFDKLVDIANVGPGVAEAFTLWRRNDIDEAGFRRAAKRAGLEQEWIDALVKAKEVLLSPSELAMMRQQGFIDRERQVNESALSGTNAERADLLFETSGLPPGVETALEMLRRSIINPTEFAQIVREGHTKTKYTDELLALRNHVVSAQTYAELYLKNWISKETRNAGGALTGYDADAMDLLSLARGRPATVRQAIIGYRRGARVDGIANNEQAYAQRSVEESSIRPEWAEIEYQSNLTYPSGFQIRGEAQAGNLTEAQTRQILHEIGWKDTWADHFAAAWTAPTAAASASFTKKAQTQLWNSTHSAFLAGDATDAVALDKLTTAGVPQAERDDVIRIWKEERELDRARLTATQLKKAFKGAVTNPLTNAPWTQDEVLAELRARGWNMQDAMTFLNL